MKLGDMTIDGLIQSAITNMRGLDDKLIALGIVQPHSGDDDNDRTITLSRGERVVVGAYIGSIGASIAVAQDKLRERSVKAEDRMQRLFDIETHLLDDEATDAQKLGRIADVLGDLIPGATVTGTAEEVDLTRPRELDPIARAERGGQE